MGKFKEGIGDQNETLFFSGYGAKIGEMWKGFIQMTTEFALKRNDDEAIIQSAKDTFDSFKNCLFEPISIGKTAS
ncbi:MAG: hypothetical protein AAB336_10090 [Acidobacteriota bacterium]